MALNKAIGLSLLAWLFVFPVMYSLLRVQADKRAAGKHELNELAQLNSEYRALLEAEK